MLYAAAAGCADGQGDASAGALGNETASVQGLMVTRGQAPCPTGSPCVQRYELARGRLVFVDGERRFEGLVPSQALASLMVLASSENLVASLRREPGCPAVDDLVETTEIEILPGVYVSGETAGCTDGPPAALRYSLRLLASQMFPEAKVDPGRPVLPPDVRPRFLFRGPPVMRSLLLERKSLHCAPTAECFETLRADAESGSVSRTGPKPSGQWTGVTDFEPLASLVFRPDVLAALRTRAPCGGVTDLAETIQVFLGPRLFMRIDSAACATGPIAEVRAAARALVERLAASQP